MWLGQRGGSGEPVLNGELGPPRWPSRLYVVYVSGFVQRALDEPFLNCLRKRLHKLCIGRAGVPGVLAASCNVRRASGFINCASDEPVLNGETGAHFMKPRR